MTLILQKSDTACPLCDSTSSSAIDTILYSDIWNWLELEWGAQFSQATIDSHFQAESLQLRNCSSCGLHYWFPALPGSPAFYSELTSTANGYYNQEKWEFEYVRTFINQEHSVLDVACGSGAFILSIQHLAREAIGIDTNASAIHQASQLGATVYETSISEFSRSNEEAFDVVTSFQVIEHLNDIMPFVESAYKCVKTGGKLVLSVPNRNRRTHTNLEALDHPPHHITRWSEAQLRELAALLGAQWIGIETQAMNKRQIISALRKKELAAIVPGPTPGREVLIKALSRLLLTFPFSLLTQSRSIREKLSLYGHTLVAVVRKPM